MKVVRGNDKRSPDEMLAKRERYEGALGSALKQGSMTGSAFNALRNEFDTFSQFVDWKVGPLHKSSAPDSLSAAQTAVSKDDVLDWMKEKAPHLADAISSNSIVAVPFVAESSTVKLEKDVLGRIDAPPGAIPYT